MKIIIFICFCLTTCFAVKDSYEDDQAADLQREIQDYLQKLTQQQHQQPPQIRPRLHLPFPEPLREPSIRNPDLLDSDEEGPPDLLFPFRKTALPSGAAGARSYASSSVTVKRPRPGSDEDEILGAEAEAVAYSSIRDVDAEEHLGDETFGKSSSANRDHDTLTTKVLSKIVSDPAARKQDLSTRQQQNTETLVKDEGAFSDVYFVAIVAGCCAAGIFGIISAGFCFYRLQKSTKAAAEVDYPAYGVTGPNKDMTSPNGDRKLAQSAQMYHYQHQKQQMIAVEKAGSTKNTSASDVDSEEENEEGDYTVYECPGLAPTGEMEVKNPLFNDDSTPLSPPPPPAKGENNPNN